MVTHFSFLGIFLCLSLRLSRIPEVLQHTPPSASSKHPPSIWSVTRAGRKLKLRYCGLRYSEGLPQLLQPSLAFVPLSLCSKPSHRPSSALLTEPSPHHSPRSLMILGPRHKRHGRKYTPNMTISTIPSSRMSLLRSYMAGCRSLRGRS